MHRNPQLEKCLQQIAEKTGGRISVSTLKRIFGKVTSEHEPQKGTLNALAQFLEFKEWDDYIAENPLLFRENNKEEGSNPIPKKWKSFLIFSVVAGAIIFLTIFLLMRSDKNALSDISFEGKYLTGTSPHIIPLYVPYQKRKMSKTLIIGFYSFY